MGRPCAFSPASLLAATCVLSALFASAPSRAASFSWDQNERGAFVVSLTRDRLGRVWAGTEDKGVWCFDPQAPDATAWRQFTVKDGLGDDNAYALAVDASNRIWVGHLNHGVSVYNGRSWKNYGAAQGPQGERVFSIAADPSGSDVWMATNAGLCRYTVKSDAWRTYGAADGLPSSQINAVACDDIGDVYVGTQTDGIAWSGPTDDYRQWRTARGPDGDKLPLVPSGEGLPSNQISDILVSRHSNAIYVATPTGLARSYDRGEHWSYLRGANWLEKARGLQSKPAESDLAEGLERLPSVGLQMLREDYVTALSEDERGRLWIGYRTQGWEVRRPRAENQEMSAEKVLFRSDSDDNGEVWSQKQLPYVSAILPVDSQLPYLAQYGNGLLKVGVKMQPDAEAKTAAMDAPQWDAAAIAGANAARLPSPQGAPDGDELNALLKKVRAVPAADGKGPMVVTLADDWRTQGDWLGRYGRYYARLHAMTSPTDYLWGAGAQGVDYAARIGPNAAPGDGLRYWVHWLYTGNPRSLETPPIYQHSRLEKGLTAWEAQDLSKQKYRRQAEIDDHGETYPMTQQGPDIYVSLRVPAGDFYLSLYDFNKDGHDGNNRLRDYRFSLRPHPKALALNDIAGFDSWPELAQGRIRDFWGGVYKRFLVRGPQLLTVQVSRNYSFNTILAGVFLDEVSEEPEPYFERTKFDLAQLRQDRRARQAHLQLEKQSGGALSQEQTVDAIWEELERVKAENPAWWATEGRGVYARLLPWFERARLRATSEQLPSLYARTATCYYQLCLFEQWEAMQKRRGLTPAREIEKSLLWDGKSSSSGQGRVAVMEAALQARQAAHPAKAQGAVKTVTVGE